jgi:DNA-binding MarR family transcriptional regulator
VSITRAARPEPPQSPATLEDDFGFALGVVFRAYVKAADALFVDVPGGPRGYQVLAAAARGQAGSQRSLAERLGVDRTVMTYLLDDLEKADLVERRADPADRRSRHIVTTAHGRERLSELERSLRSVELQVLGALPTDSQALFREQLRRIAARANELDPVDSACQVVTELDTGSAPRAAGTRKRS